MPRISKINPENASPEVRAAIDAHLSEGYRLTNEKLTLLHNVIAFNALEAQSYALDREFQRLVGKRAADFFEYAISLENDCLVCSRYFAKLLRQNGIEDFEHFAFTDEEQLLIDYGRALARDAKHIPDELFDRLRSAFSEETIVVATAMGVFMIANNVFNDALQVEPEGKV
jgi:alkylhydroperoxidase family enzyme